MKKSVLKRWVLLTIPPLMGGGGYIAGLAANGVARNESQLRGFPAAAQSATSISELHSLSYEDFEKSTIETSKKEEAKLLASSADELKALILYIKRKKIQQRKDLAPDIDLDSQQTKASVQLGFRGKGDALTWILENEPSKGAEVMIGWSEVDTAGAFDRLVSSEEDLPCYWDTLIEMLKRFGDQSPGLLKTASDRVRWERFIRLSSVSKARLLLELPNGSSVRPWVESGVAMDLKKKGIDISSLLRDWMQESPSEALVQWKTGKGLAADDPQKALIEMLQAPFSDEGVSRIRSAIDGLDDGDRQRIVKILRDYSEESYAIEYWRKIYPVSVISKEKPR